VPTEAKSHERVPLPDPVTGAGVTLHAVLLVDRLTIPRKPFSPVMAMFDVPAEPVLTVTEVGLAAIEKSWTINVTVTV